VNQVAFFIDGAYLGQVLKVQFRSPRIDFSAFGREVCRMVDPAAALFRTYYYNCLPYQANPPTPAEQQRFSTMQSFFNALNRLPRFQVRQGKLAYRGLDQNGRPIFVQKMVDVLLSIDLVQLCLKGRITDIVVLAGDSDFIPALEVAKQEGVTIWLLHGPSYHEALWNIADERVLITGDLIDRIRLQGSVSAALYS
jgi:uncharacterized LabA/DUF88 family protein